MVASGCSTWQHPRMRRPTIALLTLIGSSSMASAATHDPVAAFVRQSLELSNYKRANVDLNSDRRPEAVIYATDKSRCGSGGCTLYILSTQGSGFRVVMRSTVTQLPIRLLSTSSNGWRDIGVTVLGGGITSPYTARLRFNGRRYPSNPTVAPAIPLARPAGRVLIAN